MHPKKINSEKMKESLDRLFSIYKDISFNADSITIKWSESQEEEQDFKRYILYHSLSYLTSPATVSSVFFFITNAMHINNNPAAHSTQK